LPRPVRLRGAQPAPTRPDDPPEPHFQSNTQLPVVCAAIHLRGTLHELQGAQDSPYIHLQRVRAGQRLDHYLRPRYGRVHRAPGAQRADRQLPILEPRQSCALLPLERGVAMGVPARLHLVLRLEPVAARQSGRPHPRPRTLFRSRDVSRSPDQRALAEVQLLAEPLAPFPPPPSLVVFPPCHSGLCAAKSSRRERSWLRSPSAGRPSSSPWRWPARTTRRARPTRSPCSAPRRTTVDRRRCSAPRST